MVGNASLYSQLLTTGTHPPTHTTVSQQTQGEQEIPFILHNIVGMEGEGDRGTVNGAVVLCTRHHWNIVNSNSNPQPPYNCTLLAWIRATLC